MPAKYVPKILCKECDVWMPRLDWLTNKQCDNPNCKCPEVQKLIQATQQAIGNAQRSSTTRLEIHRGPVPHGYDAEAANGQYCIPVPDVKVITVYPTKRNGK